MITRFSLYGFLKNQRYYEPFIILFFLSKGLNFAQIGILISYRELFIGISEIPSGTFADFYGRKKSMVVSLTSYIVSFIIFANSQYFWQFFIALSFFAIGEAFRTGTHKAMIFTWLRLQNRIDEKNQVYGFTRSWSKLGSAFSIILATIFVILSNNYTSVFYYSVIPYLFGLINIMTYPKELDGNPRQETSFKVIIKHLVSSFKESLKTRKLRRLMIESMGFEGTFKAVKDYIQPIVKNFAIAIPVFLYVDNLKRSAILIGIVYFVLYLGSAIASRNSHKITNYKKGYENASTFLWKFTFWAYLGMIPFLFFKEYLIAIILFVVLYIIQNFWRPILISRLEQFATETKGATILSIESQSKALATMIIAPILGYLIDVVRLHNLGGAFYPIGIIGMVISISILLTNRKRNNEISKN